jgi:hypothetical protein
MRPQPIAAALLALAPALAFAKPCPNVMLVLDQSASMAQDPDGGMTHPSKWELLQQVMTDVVKTYGDHVPFGLELFTSMSTGNNAQCLADAQITVELSHASAADIVAHLMAASPLANTNTGEAIHRAAADMALLDPAKPDYIILVTDGSPDCNTLDLMSGTAQYTVGEITAALNAGIKTIVVGFDGAGVNKANLDSMAGAGGARVANCQGSSFGTPCYYSASSADAFKSAIDGIVSDLGAGEFAGQLCDDSCYTLGCPNGQVCLTNEQNPSPHCENDPCGGHTCGSGSFCRGGGCVAACSGGCDSSQTCADGKCVPNNCGSRKCDPGKVCNPSDGTCIDSPCPNCTDGSLCDVPSGHCVVDQCRIVNCPSGTHCVNNGNCLGHSSGCNAALSVPGTAAAAPAIALLALALWLRRARRRGNARLT